MILDNIGGFTTVKSNLKLNGDRGRMWFGKLTDVSLKERNILNLFNLLFLQVLLIFKKYFWKKDGNSGHGV